MNIENELEKSGYSNDIKTYILQIYQNNPDKFLKELRKAESNSKRRSVGGKEFNLWIAANNLRIKELSKSNPEYFVCYYCHVKLNKVSSKDIRFEHYYPKCQITGNIVYACKWCDEFKKDRKPEEYEKILVDNEAAKYDKYTKSAEAKRKLIEFAPLVACHSLGRANDIWIDKMIEIAQNNYKIDLTNIHRGQVRWKYYELYRSTWIPVG